MRLTEDERSAIVGAARRHFGASGVVRLYGSRTDDRRRGGDIDLHVVAEAPELATLDREIAFLRALEDALGERRIDVIVRAPDETERPIDRIALRDGIVL